MKAGDGWWTNLDTEISFAHIRSTFKPDERSLEWKGRWESQHSHKALIGASFRCQVVSYGSNLRKAKLMDAAVVQVSKPV